MSVFYNDNEPFVARWLENLIEAGHLPHGIVDARAIQDIQPADLAGFVHCHFFAGIGGWAYALRLAGWPADAADWTGSCPCQPLSSAGKRRGHLDERHLWPEWFRLIRQCRPPVVFGEQVASRDGLEWLDGVFADLEDAGYACGAADLCAAGVGAPHIRQRLWWVADAEGPRRREDAGAIRGVSAQGIRESEGQDGGRASEQKRRVGDSGATVGLANSRRERFPRRRGAGDLERAEAIAEGKASKRQRLRDATDHGGPTDGRLGDAESERPQGAGHQQVAANSNKRGGLVGLSGNPWDRREYVACIDGTQRPIEPGLCPLAHGVPNRVGCLHAYGNAIVPQVAATFIRAYMES